MMSLVLFIFPVIVSASAAAAVTGRDSRCYIEMATQQISSCRNIFDRRLKSFNASDPKDVKDLCCSIKRLEKCFGAAGKHAGCEEEVRGIANDMVSSAKTILETMYNIKCNYSCSAGFQVLPPPSTLLAVTTLLAIVWSSLRT